MPQGQKARKVLIREIAVPASLERLEHGLPLFGEIHLLGADDQRHVEQACLDRGESLKQARAGAGAGVVRVEDRNALQAIGPQRGLAPNAMLPLQGALARVAEPRGLYGVLRESRISQGRINGLARQVFHAALEVLAENRHPGANYIDV
ncbi:hypothetical protein D3C87_1530990 [compost metagenome]